MFLYESERFQEIMDLVSRKDYKMAKEMLSELEPIDVADSLDELNPSMLVLFFRLLPKDMAIDVFEMLELETQERFLNHASDSEIAEIIEEMSDDDRTELFDELPAKTVKKLLLQLSPQERQLANALLGYPQDSAGRIMTPEYIDLKASMTVEQALKRIREKARSKETIYSCFVTDEWRRLKGVVELEDLILADPLRPVGEIMDDAPVFVNTTDDQEMVAQTISRYDLHTIPVVDKEQRLVGIITFDDILDVVEEEATEDMELMAGIQPVEESYLDANPFVVARKRFVWLVICVVAEALTTTVMKHYSLTIERTIALTFFIPLLIGMGGNAGTQSSTVMIRDMATSSVSWKDAGRIFWQEFSVSILLGASLFLLAFGRAYMTGAGFWVSLTVGLGVIGVIILGNVVGALLPMAAKSFKLDPAIMAAPLITTVVDVLGLVVYFEIARKFLAF